MLRYVNATPIGRWTGTRAGDRQRQRQRRPQAGALRFRSTIRADTRVKGSVALGGNDVRMTPDTPLLAAAKARIDFTQSGFTVVGGSARVLGGDMSFEGGIAGRRTCASSAQGTATAEALRHAAELGALARLPAH